MFEADNSWRCSRSDILNAIFPRPEIQRYRLIEISLNVQIFHVDVQTENNGELYWSRYLFDTFRDVVSFVVIDEITSCKVSLQSSRGDSHEYSIKLVQQVFEIIDKPGAYFFKCADGNMIRDSMHEFSLEEVELILVWDLSCW